MTDRKLTVSMQTQKQRRPFTQLPPTLSQLVEDRFDEEQYDQAVELLDQLRSPGIVPPESLVHKLVALSLCSLAPGQVASTSKWTLDRQLHDISVRLLSQAKGNKSGRNVIKAASSATERPSQAAVLKATSLLLEFSETGDGSRVSLEHRREQSLLAQYVLALLPSRRRPLETPPVTSHNSPRHASRDSVGSEDGDRDGSFEASSIERWVRDALKRSEDVWDLLYDRQFSNPPEVDDVPPGRVSEFWMSQSDRRRYHRQLQAAGDTHQRLGDRLNEIRWRRLIDNPDGDSSESNSGDTSDDDALRGLSIAGRPIKRPSTSSGRGQTKASPAKGAKRARKERNMALPRDDEDAQHQQIKLTEGAWRMLSVLLRLWERASAHETSTTAKAAVAEEDWPPLLWQFPFNESTKSNRRLPKATMSNNMTGDINRALDIAFSFRSIVPAYTPVMTGTEAATDLFNTAKAIEGRGEARPISSVPQVELVHRQEIGKQKHECSTAARAETAAHLLASVYELVRLGYIRFAALIEGASERVETLSGSEVQYIMLPLLRQQPYLVAKVLATYLQDASQTHPDKIQSATRSDVQYRFGNEEAISIGAALAYAIPLEEAPMMHLRSRAMREHDPDAKSILEFLSVHRLELDGSINTSLPLTFPSKTEGRLMPLVHKQKQKHSKRDASSRKAGKMASANDPSTADAAAALTEDMEKGGLAAFAFLRAVQMECRDRINQIKFLIARALVKMHVDEATCQDDAEKAALQIKHEINPSPGASSNTLLTMLNREPANASDAPVRQRALQLFLSRLIKAFSRDADEFEQCLSAMKSHVGKDNALRRLKQAFDQSGRHESKDGLGSLPSIDAMVDRCQKCFEASQHLARSTRFLRDSVG